MRLATEQRWNAAKEWKDLCSRISENLTLFEQGDRRSYAEFVSSWRKNGDKKIFPDFMRDLKCLPKSERDSPCKRGK